MEGIKTLLSSAYPTDTGNFLALPELHTQNGTSVFVNTYAETLKANNVQVHFIETPYWLNPVLEAHFDGAINNEQLREQIYANVNASFVDDQFRDLMIDKIITGKELGIKTIGLDVRSDAIFWQDDVMNVLSERYQRDPSSLSEGQVSQLEAWELGKTYTEYTKYDGIINYLSNNGVPEDAIHGVLASLHSEDIGGNAIMTYGGAHLVGTVQSEVQGIIDESLEQRGYRVTKVLVGLSEEDLEEYEEFRRYHHRNQVLSGERYVNDGNDFRFNIETGELTNFENMTDMEQRKFSPYISGGKSLADTFNDNALNPSHLPNFSKIVAVARLNPYEATSDFPSLIDSQGRELPPHYRVSYNENGESIEEITGDKLPQFLTKDQFIANIDLIKDFNPEAYYDVSSSMSESYLSTTGAVQEDGKSFISYDQTLNHSVVITHPTIKSETGLAFQ